MSPFGSACTFVSRVIDGGSSRTWQTLNAATSLPTGTAVQFYARTSSDATNWSAWAPVVGTAVSVDDGRYLQYRADLTTSATLSTPVVSSVQVGAISSELGAPAPPTAVAGNASASVSWVAPSNTGSAITGYVVTPFVGTVAQPARTFASAATTQVVTGLTNGTTYTFRVAAKNGNGTGPRSAGGGAVTVGTPAPPAPPTAVAGNASASVSWVAPADNGSPITGYVVTPYVGTAAQPATTFASTATTQVVTGLTNGTTYTFHVAAKNGIGTGAQGAGGAALTVGVPAAPPAPTAVVGNGTASVSWTAPTATNGSAITGYVVTPFVGTVAQPARTFASTATTQSITGLTNGTTYTFKVAAKNANGTGPQSVGSTAVTVGTPAMPAAPTAVPGTRRHRCRGSRPPTTARRSPATSSHRSSVRSRNRRRRSRRPP